MIKTLLLLVSVVLICAALCGAQQTIAPEDTHGDVAHHGRRQAPGLAARSEMQQPRPIPVVNSLRFPEIPVANCADNARFVPSANATELQTASNDVQTYSAFQPSSCSFDSIAAAVGSH